MAKEEENTVPSVNQVSKDSLFRGEGEGHPRILFLGNSVTLHLPRPDVGWNGCWGMAASSEEKDYVHQFMKMVREKHPQASYRLAQIADWERAYWEDEKVLEPYRDARAYAADYIFSVILGANTDRNKLPEYDFQEHYETMIRFFNPGNQGKVIITGEFWKDEQKENCVKGAAKDLKAIFVPMDDLGDTDDMMALHEYENHGVAKHPGDKGMRTMAERLLAASGL